MGLLRQGLYVDSIALMQIAEELQRLPGIEAGAVVMGTPANLASLDAAKLRPPEADGADPNDLLVAVRATSGQAGRAALQRAEARLASSGRGDGPRVRVSGLGERWFTAPAGTPVGLYFSGFGADDANPDIGDSAITETSGIGGVAMAGAPAIVQFVGGTPADALHCTELMYEITLSESEAYRIPVLNFRGTPTGIDVRLVVQTGELPQINTGIAHRQPGIGQIGAGLVKPPRACFEAALCALAAERRRA
jgi:hypothetical protein